MSSGSSPFQQSTAKQSPFAGKFRGKGKGLGKHMGKMMMAKRHMGQDLREPIDRITKPALRRICRRAGIKRINGHTYDEMKGVLNTFTENLCQMAMCYMSHARRSTVSVIDVQYAGRRMGKEIYVTDTDNSKTKTKKK